MNRRLFVTRLFQALGVALVAPAVLAEQSRGARPAAGGATGDLALPMVDPKSPTATAVKYSLKHTDVKDAAVKVERGGVAFDKQFCQGCGFYTKAGTKDGGEVGKCTIFSGQLVKSTAWCASWNKHA